MSIFLYPKNRHIRKHKPPLFKNYRTYKRYLQSDFQRVCVYCRQPDSSAPNLNFGVDHYRPKGIARFAGLVNHYENLFYCCGQCNSRKNNYWPLDEKLGPFVVNPCEHEMASHLRFNPKTGEVEAKTPHGQCTEELLQLNDPTSIQYRLNVLKMVQLLHMEIAELRNQVAIAAKLLQKGKIPGVDFNRLVDDAEKEIAQLQLMSDLQSGSAPVQQARLRAMR